MQNITKRITDTLLERPTGFEIAGRHYCLYPPTLGVSQLVGGLVAQMRINDDNLKTSPVVELTRICIAHKDICLRIIAYSVLRGKRCLNEMRVRNVISHLEHNTEVEDIVMLLQIILSARTVNDIQSHFGIDNDLREYERISRAKHPSGTYVYCGKSIWGNLISSLAEKYGWTLDYILWGISLDNLNMLLADAPKTIYLSEDEVKELHPRRDADTICVDDPKNWDKIKSMQWD